MCIFNIGKGVVNLFYIKHLICHTSLFPLTFLINKYKAAETLLILSVGFFVDYQLVIKYLKKYLTGNI